ncbi:hypothetical protein JCM5353_007863 [Sporobolomyces roseus]
MARTLLSATALIALFSLTNAQSTIGSPNLFECAPAALQYECSKPPCQIIARPSSDPTSSLHNFGAVNDASGSVSWRPVDQKAGAVVVLYITDADGVQATSAMLTVNAASDPSNTVNAEGKCFPLDPNSSASSDGSSSSSTDGASATTSRTGATSSNAADSASSKVASITSKAGEATSKIGDAASSAANAAETAVGGSGAAGVFVKSSALAAAVLVVASALY